MERIKISHQIKSGVLPVEFFIDQVASREVPMDIDRTRTACMSCGAFGRNWGCPPYAPDFRKIAAKTLLVVCARVQTTSFPETVRKSSFAAPRFAETWLKPLTDRFGRELAKTHGGRLLNSGCCRSCPKCAKKEGNPCRDPKNRTHSLEATGILVTELVPKLFGFKLQWFSKASLPEYTCKIVAVTF